MITELRDTIVDIIPYLFPLADFLIWLLSGDIHAFAGIIGNILNILLNFAIRKIVGNLLSQWSFIYAPPNEDKSRCMMKSPSWLTNNGEAIELPSLHAQTVAFYSCYWLVAIAYNLSGNLQSFRKVIALIVLQLLGFTVVYIRYAMNYSSLSQIITGYLIGAFFGIGYYYLVRYIVNVSTNNSNSF